MRSTGGRVSSHHLLLSSAIAIACLSHATQAAPVVVVNPSFEDISVGTPFNEFTFGPPAGWQLYDPGDITDNGNGPDFYVGTLTPFETDPVANPGVYTNFPDGAAEGQRVAIAFNFAERGGEGEYGIQQTLAATLQPNTAYLLEVEIGNIASGTAMSGEFFPLDGFSGYRVELLAGGQVLNDDDNTLAGLIDDGEFGTSVISFSVGEVHPQLGQPLGIRLINLNEVDPLHPESDLEVDFDNVRLDATSILPGDYNNDGTVNLADYTVWRDNVGAAAGTLANDPSGVAIGPAQYNTWTTNFGASTPATAVSAVPEPISATLMIAGSIGFVVAASQRGPRPTIATTKAYTATIEHTYHRSAT